MNMREWLWRFKRRQLPEIRLQIHERHGMASFVKPHPWMQALAYHPLTGALVARAGYGVGPLCDRFYLGDLHVEPALRRQGYATALLAAVSDHVAAEYGRLPLTPLHETGAARGFWDHMRQLAPKSLPVTRDLRGSEVDEERMRWARPATEAAR
jgi:GNAT superfamily N-acetyltransferase